MVINSRCNGYFNIGKPCNRYVNDNQEYCESHSYFKDLSKEQVDKIVNGDAYKCIRCPKFHFDSNRKQCDDCCLEKSQYQKDKKAQLDKCKWFDRNNDPCRSNPINSEEYCKFHLYVKDYSDEMKNKSVLCNGCRKIKFLGEFGSCEDCRERGKKNREVNSSNKVLCKGYVGNKNCEFEALSNGYCGKHQRLYWKDGIEKDGTKKVCIEWVRGCNEILDMNCGFSRCDKCRAKERVYDKRTNINNLNIIVDDEEISEEDIEIKENNKELLECVDCYENYEPFINGTGKISKRCKKCWEKRKIREGKRDRSNRDYSKYDNRPEVKERKAQWKEENYDKVVGYSIEARARQIEKLGVEEYNKQNADYAKKWRQNNPDKVKEQNEKKNLDIFQKYKYYKREAENKGRKYYLTFGQSKKYFLDDCYYCGDSAFDGLLLNGIDRKNNNGDYILENCVSACEMCNIMKGDELDDKEFIKACEHILTNLGIVEGNLYPEVFRDYLSGNYYRYKSGSKKRGIYFELNEHEFYNIVTNNCYLCNKHNSEKHNNGIDRINNNIGYYFKNCKSCCGTCNYMKNNYNLIDMVNKFVNIYNFQNKNKSSFDFSQIKSFKDTYIINYDMDLNIKRQERNKNSLNSDTLSKKIKKTKEQIREEARLRKQKQRELLRKKYGDEEYKKMHAKQIAENRAKKKLKNND